MVDQRRASWRKSSRSNASGNCVEVAANLSTTVMLRDSKDPGGPVLSVVPETWIAFVNAVHKGQFDL